MPCDGFTVDVPVSTLLRWNPFPERELTEAGEVESALLELMRWLGSPCIVLPLGVIALAMSALAYSGHVNLAIPWWLCAMLGLEALADGLDSLLRKRRPPGPP